MAVPSRVLWMSSHESPMRPSAVSTTKTRSGAMPTGPTTSGAVGNGCGIERATPPQASSSAFWSAIQSPIMTSIVVSMDSSRSGRSKMRSTRAPAAAPITRAAATAVKKPLPARASAANVA